MSIKLSICIPVFNQQAFTKQCLLDLSVAPKEFEILIWDNGSTDLTQKIVEEISGDTFGPKIHYFRSDVNLGFGAACNNLYKRATGDVVLFLNNDIRIKDKFAKWWEQPMQLALDGAIVGLEVGLLDQQFNFLKEGKEDPTAPLSYLSGWFLMGTKKTFDRLANRAKEKGPDHLPFFMGLFVYFEDVLLSWRARSLGITLKRIDLPIHHFGRQTGKKMNMSQMYSESKSTFINYWKGKYEKSG